MSCYDLNRNISAFLDMLAFSEGTIRYGDQDGYNVLVGGETFDSYADHPRRLVYIPNLKLKSSAAGRYQLLARYFDHYKKLLGLKDFSPLAQDLIAIQQIKEQEAYVDIKNGDIPIAIKKCNNIWASLPGAGYGQHEHKLATLLDEYERSRNANTVKT